MATAKDLLGIWRGDAMFVPDSQTHEVLALQMDGTAFLEWRQDDPWEENSGRRSGINE